ncbi:serine/threonine dehydratase [Sciscionella marina]|uniref:serine/threonine dehydratase n=1 Tax=Sciscionella marina TaxID=508770 RepID=UPI0003748F03|nr:serine/threonine dehydratase [Sciscionella marina]
MNPDPATARRAIGGLVRTTPVLHARADLLFKLEQHQVSGTFKARGAFTALTLAREQGTLPAAGVVAASGGNHGIAVATAATTLGIPAHVFIPEAASSAKRALLEASGAKVTVAGALYADALEASRTEIERTGAMQIHAYDQPEVVAGQATLGLELLEQAEFDTVLVAVGGGGLLGGIVTGLAGSLARIVAVEPELIPSMHAALAAGGPVQIEVSGLTKDSLGASKVGALPYRLAAEAGVHSVLVPEAEIQAAHTALWQEFRIAAEYSAATAYAALRCGAYRPRDGERIVVLICGANVESPRV